MFSANNPPELSQIHASSANWTGLCGSADALAIAATAARDRRVYVILTPTNKQAQILHEALNFYGCERNNIPVTIFPSWECLAYDTFSPHKDIVSQRVKILSKLSLLSQHVLIVSAGNLMQRLPPVDYISSTSFVLNRAMDLDFVRFCDSLNRTAYTRVPQVELPGEYTVRGAVIDVFPMGSDHPIRIELLDDKINTIRVFDAESQLSIERVERFEIFPGGEIPLDEQSIRSFRQGIRGHLDHDPKLNRIYSAIDSNPPPNGIEFYLPLFFESTSTLLDYLPENNTQVFVTRGFEQAANAYWTQILERFELAKSDESMYPLPPEMLYLHPTEIEQHLTAMPTTRFDAENALSDVRFNTCPPIEIQSPTRRQKFETLLESSLNHYNTSRVAIVVDSSAQHQLIVNSLDAIGKSFGEFQTWQNFATDSHQLGIIQARLSIGTHLVDENIAIVTGTELFGRQTQSESKRIRTRNPEAIIASMEELAIGDPVVHEQYGIGRFQGLTTMNVSGAETEFMTIEYLNSEILYVPIYSIDCVSRYVGGALDQITLHSLSSKTWSKQKFKARNKAYDIAVELLHVQSLRQIESGEKMSVPHADYQEFVADFPYQETPDQQSAIEAVIADLKTDRPMDRLICGDVGFGKTEVAMRAALISASNGSQVAVVVPTTLLSQQHYEVFSDRFVNFGIRVEQLSSMVDNAKLRKVKSDLEHGKVDIIIGTHKLLQASIRIPNLGLLVIDEEHRFGVRQKEHLKKYRASVNVLTLTATPIPRTLSMALNQVRDISILSTPPNDRLSVRTFVRSWNSATIREACLREIGRGGQIFYVHNRVKTINYAARELKKIVPEANIQIAHGRMSKIELEQIMRNFYTQKFDTLVCSTIIESGIDIPTANTIIVNDASNFGLAQLHQLRGRVGRSYHQAYAYFLVRSLDHLTTTAKRRLQSIAELDQLGVGYLIATHDLEIRGAGSILGEEQSGVIDTIGYSMYAQYLNEAVKFLAQSDSIPDNFEMSDTPAQLDTQVNLHAPALFPDDWIPSTKLRLTLYRRIASASDSKSLSQLKTEMTDRFGKLPHQASMLFDIYRLKTMAQSVGITNIDVGMNNGKITFDSNATFDMIGLKELLSHYPGTARLDQPNNAVKLQHYLSTEEKRLKRAYYIVETLSQDSLCESSVRAAG